MVSQKICVVYIHIIHIIIFKMNIICIVILYKVVISTYNIIYIVTLLYCYVVIYHCI